MNTMLQNAQCWWWRCWEAGAMVFATYEINPPSLSGFIFILKTYQLPISPLEIGKQLFGVTYDST